MWVSLDSLRPSSLDSSHWCCFRVSNDLSNDWSVSCDGVSRKPPVGWESSGNFECCHSFSTGLKNRKLSQISDHASVIPVAVKGLSDQVAESFRRLSVLSRTLLRNHTSNH